MASNKIKSLLPVAILALAVLTAYLLIKSRPEAANHIPEKIQPLVKIQTVKAQTVTIPIAAQGNVRPRTEAEMVSEVAGKIIAVADNFHSGGFFAKGDMLIRVENSKYLAAVKRAEASIASAQSALASEQGRSVVALKEWQQRGKQQKRSQTATDLYLRKPQLQEMQARLASAKADLIQANNDLENTRLIAPYAGIISNKQADIGQYVSPGQKIATLFAVDKAEVQVPIAEHTLAFLETSVNKQNDAKVVLRTGSGNRSKQWLGQLVRTDGVFNERTRSITAVIEVDDPYGFLGNSEHKRQPLRIGTFVSADIEGKTLNNIIPMSLAALKPGNKVWVINSDNKLESRQVDVLLKTRTTAFITTGLSDGDRVSLTPLSNYVSGMRVRLVKENATDSNNAQLKLSPPDSANKKAGH